uniref:Mediator complex subunit 15 KIX domain-containing protein n=2 Tax=Vitis vinifera TaxID=29760 RepID=F6I246_VITVI
MIIKKQELEKSMDTLKRHLPIFGPEGLHELRKIVERFEEKIYSAATSQSDYLRKISLKMLTMETKSFNVATNSLPSNSAGHNKKSLARKKALRSRPHWMILCTHECLFSMQADGPRFDERSCEGLVATQADNKQHAD